MFLEGWAPLLVCSGHLGGLTSGMWTRSEAEIFADVAVGRGVPRERILIERRSTNTGENVDFSRQLLAERGIPVSRAIAVQKPYMERRTLATSNGGFCQWVPVAVAGCQPGGMNQTANLSRQRGVRHDLRARSA